MATNVRSMQGDVSERTSTITKNLQEVGDSARRMATDQVEALRETASEYLDQGRARVRELGDTVQHRVQEQPIQSILIAAAAGFLLGVLWVRR
jgi:ElaB/YqjD/DUF883 family membrane-anchored ribosome-binding protein